MACCTCKSPLNPLTGVGFSVRWQLERYCHRVPRAAHLPVPCASHWRTSRQWHPLDSRLRGNDDPSLHQVHRFSPSFRPRTKILQLLLFSFTQELDHPPMALFSVISRPPLHTIDGLCVFSHFFSAEQQRIDSRAKLGAAVAFSLQREIGWILLGRDHKPLPSLFNVFLPAARLPHRAEAVIPANRATQGK